MFWEASKSEYVSMLAVEELIDTNQIDYVMIAVEQEMRKRGKSRNRYANEFQSSKPNARAEKGNFTDPDGRVA
jgi:hypothetical protein